MGKDSEEIPVDVLAESDQFIMRLEEMLDSLIAELQRLAVSEREKQEYDRTKVIMMMGTALATKLDTSRLGYVLAVTLMRLADPRSELTL